LKEHDPALVAAALLALSRQPSAVSQPSPVASPHRAGEGLRDGRTKDRASAKDLVGALIKEVGCKRPDWQNRCTGDFFSDRSIARPAEQAVRQLTGVSIATPVFRAS